MPATSHASRAHMRAQVFATTRWTVVMAAGRNSSPAAREAMEALCKTYWYPLYAFVRRAGHSAHDAQDLTQSFFERFLEKNFLGDIHRDRGKFRSFLLAALKHFLANEWDRAHAQKRGGKVAFISIDEQTAEERYRLEPADHLTAEKIYARRWACTLLDNVLELLKEEFKKAGKAAEFARMKVFLSGERASLPYAEMAPKLGMSEAALKVAVHRVRKRYRELLRAEIAQTLENPADVDSEIRELYAALGN